MPTAISGTSSPSSSIASTSGINTMTGADFLNLMIMQLQQQDPLNPTDSNQLLTQLSQISTLQSNAVEESNVNLSGELVNLIVAQRNYQANAQTIKAQDTVLQTLVNI